MSRRAAFLDRDGTLNVRPPEHEYVRRPQDFHWLPGAPDAVATLARAGFSIAVVSNQRGLSRGLVSEATLAAIEQRIQADLAEHGCSVEAFRYCPHDLSSGCDCRKPAPGMLTALASERGYDLAASWMVGDAPSDIAAGIAAGCRTAQVADAGAGADIEAPDLLVAAERIVELTARDAA